MTLNRRVVCKLFQHLHHHHVTDVSTERATRGWCRSTLSKTHRFNKTHLLSLSLTQTPCRIAVFQYKPSSCGSSGITHTEVLWRLPLYDRSHQLWSSNTNHCLQGPIRSLGRLPLGLGSLNKIPCHQRSLCRVQDLTMHESLSVYLFELCTSRLQQRKTMLLTYPALCRSVSSPSHVRLICLFL